MKRIMAVDSPRLIVIDEKVKERGLFSYILTRVIAWFSLLGLTTYGFFYAILHPKAISFYERIDSIDQRYVIVFVVMGFVSLWMYWVVKRIKNN
jgi:hypothetical protein